MFNLSMKTTTTLIYAMLAAATLGGCASPSKTLPCASTDWYELGRQEGSRGVASVEPKHIGASCKSQDQALDAKSLFESGRSLGLAEYCTEANGFLMGKANVAYKGTCPQILEESFLRGYKRGKKSVQLTNDKQDLKSRIQSVESDFSKAKSLAWKGLLKAEMIDLHKQRDELDQKIAKANRPSDAQTE